MSFATRHARPGLIRLTAALGFILLARATVTAREPAPRAPAPARPPIVVLRESALQLRGPLPRTSPPPWRDTAANALVFRSRQVAVTVLGGPAGRMLSFRIAGLTNPTLVVPTGARVTVTFVNVDDDMDHNFAITTMPPPFARVPAAGTIVGTPEIPPGPADRRSGEVLVFRAVRAGHFFYLCTVAGHARGGMWGRLEIRRKGDPGPR